MNDWIKYFLEAIINQAELNSNLHTSVLNKGGVLADEIGWNLNHAMLSGFWLSFMSE